MSDLWMLAEINKVWNYLNYGAYAVISARFLVYPIVKYRRDYKTSVESEKFQSGEVI